MLATRRLPPLVLTVARQGAPARMQNPAPVPSAPWSRALRTESTMAETASSRSDQRGQFRLTRLQVVNWGTFCGYKDLAIDKRGVLFTGPSGSGKSSLLDAHSVALLPTRDQRFNASADLTAKGAKQSTRSAADYVRGAWSENDDEHGQSHVRYLRGGKPTWSAIGVTYDDGLGSVTTGVVVKWFTGTETDGAHLKTMHQLHEGHFDLTAREEWAQKGFDLRWLKAAFPPPLTAYPASETEYERGLAKRVGLGTSKTALSLLGKAKAMKNVGDLNMFIRENMLGRAGDFCRRKNNDRAVKAAERGIRDSQARLRAEGSPQPRARQLGCLLPSETRIQPGRRDAGYADRSLPARRARQHPPRRDHPPGNVH